MIFNGNNTSKEILESLKSRVADLPFVPEFSDILATNDGPSVRYVNMKKKIAEKVGIKFIDAVLPDSPTEQDIINKINEIALRPNVCGIIVQLPLPNDINIENVLNAVPLNLDVDGLSAEYNKMFYTSDNFENVLIMPTVLAIDKILNIAIADKSGKKIAVVGQGRLVGQPLTHVLKSKGYSVDTINKDTNDTMRQDILQNADIVISAVGKPGLIKKDDVKNDVIVIDAGTMEMENTLVGDVMPDVIDKASFMTPTPGGVGPMTVAALIENVVRVAEDKLTKKDYN